MAKSERIKVRCDNAVMMVMTGKRVDKSLLVLLFVSSVIVKRKESECVNV